MPATTEFYTGCLIHLFSNAGTIQLCITNDACQPQMDPHSCYFEYLIIHCEYLIIPFDRHTSQWRLSQNLGNGFCHICFVQI